MTKKAEKGNIFMATQTLAVIAISSKKEKGWLKLATLNGASWSDLGAHFDKIKFGTTFTEAGIYELDFQNTADFGAMAAYSVISATKIGTFTELVALAKHKK